ncbi:MAG: phosphate starvation-inducible protein PsiF [Proteobacteria bacterium]|nr:phosphate starvation-inducible protein PsiF [Pseudomonadota bacterium]
MRIRTTMLALCLSLGALAVAPAFAAGAPASSAKAMTAQQQKMATCSHESKGMKGEEHKKFMSDCLHGKTAAAEPAKTEAAAAPMANHKATQQEKMKTCNADAKTKALKGAARKEFMSTCLKG